MKRPIPRLAETTLPVMQETTRELHRLLELPSTRNAVLQAVMLCDPAATVAVFRELELSRPGAAEQVGDVAHALSLIGMDRLRRLLDRLPVLAKGSESARPGGGPVAAYSQAAHAARYAAALSRRRAAPAIPELATAALLQNPAVLALSTLEPESALRAANAIADGVPPAMAYGAELGEPLEQANRRLAAAWALPRLARQAMDDWDDFNPRPMMISLASSLALSSAAGWRRDETETLSSILAELLGTDTGRAIAWLHGQAVDAARALQPYGYPLPAFGLLFLPGEPEGDAADEPVRVPRIQARARAHAAGSDLHERLADLMGRIRHEARAGRVIFAMLSADRRRLRTRLALGGDPADDLRRLDLPLSQRNLFTALVGKPQSLWLNRGNAARYRDLLPPDLRRMLGPQGAYMMSLFIDGRPLGLMYGDGTALSDQGYRRFRLLCQEATAALGAESTVVRRVGT